MVEQSFSFSQMLEMLKCGYLFTRAAWPNKFTIHLVKGAHDFSTDERTPSFIAGISEHFFESGDKGIVTRLPHIQFSVDGGYCVWTPTIIDIMADDWMIISKPEDSEDTETK